MHLNPREECRTSTYALGLIHHAVVHDATPVKASTDDICRAHIKGERISEICLLIHGDTNLIYTVGIVYLHFLRPNQRYCPVRGDLTVVPLFLSMEMPRRLLVSNHACKTSICLILFLLRLLHLLQFSPWVRNSFEYRPILSALVFLLNHACNPNVPASAIAFSIMMIWNHFTATYFRILASSLPLSVSPTHSFITAQRYRPLLVELIHIMIHKRRHHITCRHLSRARKSGIAARTDYTLASVLIRTLLCIV